MTEKRENILRETDDEARTLARRLIDEARYAALAFADPKTGYPAASQVLIATDVDGCPTLLASRLAGHTKALLESGKCGLLVGEPGKGDPMAWPRMSLQCDAVPVAADAPHRTAIRERFLEKNPKAKLYADFGDFLFFRLEPTLASLNGGFGKAYALTSADLKVNGKAAD